MFQDDTLYKFSYLLTRDKPATPERHTDAFIGDLLDVWIFDISDHLLLPNTTKPSNEKKINKKQN